MKGMDDNEKNVDFNDILYVGIDPDVSKSGYAVVSKNFKSVTFTTTDGFFYVLDRIRELHSLTSLMGSKMVVVVEAGWLNRKSNFRDTNGARGENIAKKVGANHQIGKLFIEYCKALGIDYIEARPMVKCWKGPDRKITQKEIEQFIPGFPAKSNQEIRDAALLAWVHAGFPIRVKV